MRKVRREGPVQVWTKRVEVDLDYLIVRGTLVSAEVLLERVRRGSDARALSRLFRGTRFTTMPCLSFRRN